MDIKHGNDYRTGRLSSCDNIGDNKYDYGRNGVLRHCLPKVLFKGNSVLVSFLQLIDMKLIMLLKWIDRVKKFKWIYTYY